MTSFCVWKFCFMKPYQCKAGSPQNEKQKKMIAQEGSSVSNTDETELDQLPQNIVEEFQEASVNYKKDMTEKQEKGLKNR